MAQKIEYIPYSKNLIAILSKATLHLLKFLFLATKDKPNQLARVFNNFLSLVELAEWENTVLTLVKHQM